MKKSTGAAPIIGYQSRETLALLRILELGNRQIERGKVTPAADVFRRLLEKLSRS